MWSVYQTTARSENPAKKLLNRYKWLKIECANLHDEIETGFERATNCTVKLNPMKTSGGAAAHDRMAEDVCGIVDAKEKLRQYEAELNAVIDDITGYLRALEDERQKTVILLKYIRGKNWTEIQQEIGYEKTRTLELHGHALLEINRMMQKSGLKRTKTD